MCRSTPAVRLVPGSGHAVHATMTTSAASQWRRAPQLLLFGSFTMRLSPFLFD